MEPIFREDAYARTCEATVVSVDERGIQLDRTVFYPTGGGQPGDRGALTTGDGTAVPIVDTVKGDGPDGVLHVPAEEAPPVPAGARVTAEIDWERRHRLMRMHTCMHLLSAILPYPVTGGQVGEGKGRLDFDVPEASLDKERIAAELNRLIEEDHPVGAEWITDEELDARPDLVKTMAVKPPRGSGRVRPVRIEGQDLQPCGGTHVRRTGEIGRVAVDRIQSKGKRNRRVSLSFA